MSRFTSGRQGWQRVCFVAVGGILWMLLLAAPPARAQLPLGSVPNADYYAAFDDYHDGNYVAAGKGFVAAGRGAIKAGSNYWIDSICYHTMAGECLYQMGQYRDALARYDTALNLYLSYPNWLVQVRFPPTVVAASRVSVAPWGASTRGVQSALIPDKIPIAQGSFNLTPLGNNQFGAAAPQERAINVKEIVRCICLALRRKRELMGPVGPLDEMTERLVSALVQGPAQPNHWSACWDDLKLALAHSLAGKDAQAKPILQRAILAGGQMDHDLTCVALHELGRIALSEADFATASGFFEEAGYSAFHYGDVGMLEESLRYGFLTHVLANRPEVYPPVGLATPWATKQKLRQLSASLLIMTAENAATLGEPSAAATALANLSTLIRNNNLSLGRLGARANWMAAWNQYQLGHVAKGDEALQAALSFQSNGGSLWLFHMNLVDAYYQNNSDKWRTANQLFEMVLRDPTPADWLSDPLEALSALTVPHPEKYEHWFELAVSPRAKQAEAAIEIADALKRHRFLNSTLLGGRALALRWLLEGPETLLNQKAIQEKQDLLTRYEAWSELSKETHRLHAALDDLPLVPGGADQQKEQTASLARLTEVTLLQEALLRQIAVRREAASITFPPRIKAKEFLKSMPEGTGLLAFQAVKGQLWAFLVSKDRYEPWQLGPVESLRKPVGAMLRGMGNFDANAPVALGQLKEADWQKPARDLFTGMFTGSRQNVPAELQELIIVPDSLMWYVPFEALPISGDKEAPRMISKVRIRYTPLASLALPDSRSRPRGTHVAAVLGKMHPNLDPEVSQQRFAQLTQAISGASAVGKNLPAGSAIYSSLFDQLIVMDDLNPAQHAGYNLAPLSLDRGKPLSTLDDWLGLPWRGPDQIMLPGFHTMAEHSLNAKKKVKLNPGEDLFVPACGLMGTGARTILLSRWRTGGASSFNLVREFAQELPHVTASAAWQRSVQLAMAEPLDPALEPRVNPKGGTLPETTAHPFFWAGYLLIDTGVPPERSEKAPAEPPTVVKKPGKAAARPAEAAGENPKEKPQARPQAQAPENASPAEEPANGKAAPRPPKKPVKKNPT